MVPGVSGQERWFRQTGEECALQVVAICDALRAADGADRRTRYFSALSRYEARSLSNESMRPDGGVLAFDDELYNVSRSAVDTAQAEIASRQRPKPMFLTTGADWRTKRKAKKLDKCVEAQLHLRQGARYADAWQLTEDVFRDAEIAVGGVIKVVVDIAQERVRLERVPCYEILVDPLEAAKGDPQNWFHVYEMDLDAAIEQFAGDDVEDLTELDRTRIRAYLEGSADVTRGAAADISMTRTSPVVVIYEAWRMRFSAKKPGKHVFACKAGALCEEEFAYSTPPLVILTWQSEAFGVWGTGLVESGAAQHDKINEMSEDMHMRLKLCASKYVYYTPGADIEAMKGNEYVTFVPVTDPSKIPHETMNPPVTAGEIGMVDREISKYFEIQGVSQVSAEQRHEAGVESAVAQQTLNDIKGVRFLPKARAYELMFVPIGDLIVRGMRDLAVHRPGIIAKWPGAKYLESIKWSDVNMDEDMYWCRVAPVSAMSRDPAQRLQIVEQLVGMGFLSKDKYLELLNMPDLDSVLESDGAETQWVEKLVDRYLDAEDNDELKKLGGFTEPDGYLLNPTGALVTVAQHYFASMVDDVPNYNANLLRRFMSSLQRLIKTPAPQAAAPAAAPGAAAVPGAPGIVPPVGAPVGLGMAA